MKNRRNIIIVIVSSVLFICLLLYLLFYVFIINNASYKYNKYYDDDSYYIPNKIEQEYIVLLGEAGYSCEFSYPFEEGGQEEFDELVEDASILCEMTKSEDIDIDLDNMLFGNFKVEIDGNYYSVGDSISLSKINNIYVIYTFFLAESYTSAEYEESALRYVNGYEYSGKIHNQYGQENHRLTISRFTCSVDNSFLENDMVIEDVLLNKIKLEESDFSKFSDYEKGRKDSIEESMEICEETIDIYGEQFYEDIVHPLKESRLEIIPKLLEIIGEK